MTVKITTRPIVGALSSLIINVFLPNVWLWLRRVCRQTAYSLAQSFFFVFVALINPLVKFVVPLGALIAPS